MPSGPNQSIGVHGTQPGGWVGEYGGPPPSPRRGGKLASIGIVVAVVLSAAALVVGIVALVRQPGPSLTATPTSAPVTTSAGDTSAADKALCEKVGPRLKEIADIGRNFVALGRTGTPERDAGIAKYRAAVQNWTNGIQPILDANANPSRYLTRTLQSFVDLNQLYADNIRPGDEQPSDSEAWNAGTTAYGGPLTVCQRLGVTW